MMNPVGLTRRYLIAPLTAICVLVPQVLAADDPVPGTNSTNGSSVVDQHLESTAGSYLAARFAWRGGDPALASDFLQPVLVGDPANLRLRDDLRQALVLAGRVSEAIEISGPLSHSSNLSLFLLQYVDALESGDLDRMHELFENWSPAGPAIVPILRAWLAVQDGDHAAALALLEESKYYELSNEQERSGFDPLRSLHSALISNLAGDVQQAARHFEIALEEERLLAYTTARAYIEFLDQHDRSAEIDTAFQNNTWVRSALWFEPLMEAYQTQSITDDTPNPFRLYIVQVFLTTAQLQNMSESALYFARLAEYLLPENDLVALTVGETLHTLMRYESARATLGQIGADELLYLDAQLQIARSLSEVEKVDEASDVLVSLLSEHMDKSEIHAELGRVYLIADKWQHAVDAFDNSFAQYADPADIPWYSHFNLGIALERSDNWDRAENVFHDALEKYPEHPGVLNYLGYSWIDMGKNLDEAMSMVERAVEQEPWNGYYIDSLGWAHYRLGNYMEAVKHLESAMQYSPGEPVIADHLGDTYWKIGREELARFQWQRALELGADDGNLEELLRLKLESGLE